MLGNIIYSHTVTRQSLACQSDTALVKPPSLLGTVKCELWRMAAPLIRAAVCPNIILGIWASQLVICFTGTYVFKESNISAISFIFVEFLG